LLGPSLVNDLGGEVRTMVMVEGDHAVYLSDPARFSAKLLEACLGTQTPSSD
jgi:hypothetical protein